MNSYRQLVQYHDLEQNHSATSSAAQPHPYKKRKRFNQKTQCFKRTAHWDDPETPMRYENTNAQAEDREFEQEESQDLTHEEMWDDSALIDAWNSATAEYEAFHGKSQEWKFESKPVQKSPLWYNIPHNNFKEEAKSPNKMASAEDSPPFNFDTFVPSHDPSLPLSSEPSAAPMSSSFVPASTNTLVSPDEAFNRALSAMYWGGYWTAVYHCQTQKPSLELVEEQDQQCKDDDEGALEDHTQDLVPAQR